MAKTKPDDEFPDIPVQNVKSHDVADEFDAEVAFNLAFVGIGQGGGRLAAAFHELGYRRVVAINTDHADLAALPGDVAKLDLRTGGAGKDPRRGQAAVADQEQAVFEALTRAIGKQPDYLLICAGLGGGTGSGGVSTLVKIARKYMTAQDRDERRVGAIISLPHPDEGQTPCRNALQAFQELSQLQVSPLIILDNKRISEQFSTGVASFYAMANKQVSLLFHLFNRMASQKSPIVTFDRADFASLLDSGICVFGASRIDRYDSPADISGSIRDHLAGTILAEVDLQQAQKAGCIFVASEEILSVVPMDFFGGGYTMLTRLMAEGSVVHRGIYAGGKGDLRCYTMLASLPIPSKTLARLAAEGRISNNDSIASFLNV